jgi:O-antigen/teichoic acid export membrane protein
MLVQARRVLVGLLVCASPLVLVLGVYGSPLVQLLYGPAFAPGGPVLQVFGLVLMATYLNIYVARLLEVMDRQRIWAGVMLVAVLLALPMNWLLISWSQGAGQASLGAAVGLLLSELAMTIPGLVILSRYHLGRVCLVVLAKGGLALLAAAACLALLTPISLVLAVGVAALAYGAVAWWLRIVPPDDLARGWAIIRTRLPQRKTV